MSTEERRIREDGGWVGESDFQSRGPSSLRDRPMHQRLREGVSVGREGMEDSLANYDGVIFELILHGHH